MVYVIIPVYNVAPYLRECLDSVLNSTYRNLSVVCIDDGSTDESPGILENYARQNPLVKVITTDNHGVASAKNQGLDYVAAIACEDDYILFVDADDFIGGNYISTLVHAATSGKYDIVCTSFTFSRGERRWNFRGMEHIFGEHDPFDACKILLEDKTIQSHSWSKLYRASLWKGIRFPLMRFMEDQPATFQLFCKSNKVLFLKNYDCFYRQRDASLCSDAYTPGKAIDALNGYLLPYVYPYEEFDENQRKILKTVSGEALAACFLSVCWRFDQKRANENQKAEWKRLLAFIRQNHLIKNYSPTERKEKQKRLCYLYARCLYKPLFRLASARK